MSRKDHVTSYRFSYHNTLRDKDDPVVMIREEEGEFQGEAWVEYDKVVVYVDSGHILCDLAGTWV